jgi:hypothetical protein
MQPHITPNQCAQENIEEWRDVPGYEGYYQVSSFGRVRSMDRTDAIGRPRYSRIMKPGIANGYFFVHLCKQKVGWVQRTHVLVALAFLGPRPDGLCINHKDANRANNCVGNLEYVTYQENTLHAAGLGKMGKLSKEQVWEVREAYSVNSSIPYAVYAEKFNVTRGVIADIVRVNRRKAVKNRDGSEPEAIHRHKLEGVDVYALYKSGMSLNAIARQFGVYAGTVSRAYHKAAKRIEGHSDPLTTKRV